MICRVLVATDGSDAALTAVRSALELTRSLGPDASLHVVSAIDYAGVPSMLAKRPPNAPDLLADQAESALAEAAEVAAEAGIAVTPHLMRGEVVPAILRCAAEVQADLLVAGFHGRSGRLVRLVMGSVVGNLVRSTSLPVVVVPSPHAGQPP